MNKKATLRVLNSVSDNLKSKIKNLKWLGIFAIVLTFALGGVVALAQQPAKIPRIGYVSGSGSASDQGPYVEALRQGLRDLGYIEGKHFVIEYRGAEGKPDRMPSLATELIQLKVDVLVLPTSATVLTAKQATKTIPIVMVTQVDPVATGLVDSLARPGGNVTGIASLQRELSGKRLELLAEVVPRLTRVGVLRNPDERATAIGFDYYEAVARPLKIKLQSLDARGPNPDLEGAFREAVKWRANAVITITTNAL
ncbi:MAG TPA: ABC transporter substrate-binding protein, partial [Candidatus Binatia bacterium]|nr:ABC transporter substrate-binding protein [Candidatus Binatia bacterium]